MNNSQKKSIVRFINRAEQFFKYIHNDSIEYIHGPVVWSIESTLNGCYWLRCTNITEEWRWFHSSVHMNVLIGKRGSIKIYSCDGIDKNHLI